MSILLFDGHCNLCSSSVQWVLKRDKRAVLRFASLQSDVGQKLLAEHGLLEKNLDSVVLLKGGRAFTHSDAPLEAAKLLGFPWAMAYIFKALPRFFRDAAYRWIATNRYKWFGRKEQCWLPLPEWKSRFLD